MLNTMPSREFRAMGGSKTDYRPGCKCPLWVISDTATCPGNVCLTPKADIDCSHALGRIVASPSVRSVSGVMAVRHL